MYEEFFGLSEKPFSILPDPAFLYWGRGHRLAYAMLEYGVLNQAGISIVTGEVGCGKTTLIHRLLDQLSDTHTVALISNIQEGRGDLLSWVLMGFGQPFAGKSHVELFAQIQSFFIGEYAKGRRVVLIIDEAQNLSVDMLEELRMLSNINAGKDQLLQLILVGQPQLKELLNRPDMLQLAQRVGADFHLQALGAEEVAAYIDTRLSIAGAKRRIFTDRAVELIAEQSAGVPRVINIIADTALVYAFSAQDLVVDVEIVRNVIRDKNEYGVFGYAARINAPAGAEDSRTRSRADGPTAFIKGEPNNAGGREQQAEARPAGYSSSVLSSMRRLDPPHDAPRMPARRQALAAPQPALQSAPEGAALRAVENRLSFRSAVEAEPAPRQIAMAGGGSDALAAAPRPEASSFPETPLNAAPSQTETLRERVGVVVVGAGARADATIRSPGQDFAIIYVAADAETADAAAARAAGAEVVVADSPSSLGRARNAGYRSLKRRRPGLRYVQFLEAGAILAPGWLEAAARFMERRPEVAALEGRAGGGEEEIRTTGENLFVRAEAFEAAGGYRGDLAVNETRDLCIRLRRRGGRVWRLDTEMIRGDGRARPVSFAQWWRNAQRAGYEYAHGVRLHGGRPERLFVREHLQTLVWGAGIPVLVILAALAAAALARITDAAASPLLAAAAPLAAGAATYLARVIVIAVRRGPGRLAAWRAALAATFASFPEFAGAWRFYFPAPSKRAKA